MDPRFRKYAELVLEKNKLLNLTAAATVDEILSRHIGDGLAGKAWLDKRHPGAFSLADVGAGAGFIGMALAIARPDMKLTLIESRKGRTEFMEWAAVKLGLKANVLRARAEDVKETFDVVVERALAPIEESLALCLPLTTPGGVFMAWLSEISGEPKETLTYRLDGENKDRYILCFQR